MKNLVLSIVLIVSFSIQITSQEISPYIKIGETKENIQKASENIISALKDQSFTILGSYNPADKNYLKVIAFTQENLKNTVIKVKDRGALAAIFKIGLEQKEGKVILSYTNPEYILRAYLGDEYTTHKNSLQKFSSELRNTLSSIGNEFSPFGGTVKAKDLKKYHYKIMMPYFTDPIELKEFTSFNTGLKTIENNLKSNIGKTELVYKLVYPSQKVAVFGVGLKNQEDGEAYFLPKIGEAHVAALPYEIILEGNVATILHGKYRIALHWPDLTMGTFMKIMSTPGDIEETFESLCQ